MTQDKTTNAQHAELNTLWDQEWEHYDQENRQDAAKVY